MPRRAWSCGSIRIVSLSGRIRALRRSQGGDRIRHRPQPVKIRGEPWPDTERQTGGEVLERTRQETKKPELFKVLLLNDDYTTMDFVVEILESVFHKQPAEAYRIMMAVHTQGKGLCGAVSARSGRDEGRHGRSTAPARTGSRCWRRWNRNSSRQVK